VFKVARHARWLATRGSTVVLYRYAKQPRNGRRQSLHETSAGYSLNRRAPVGAHGASDSSPLNTVSVAGGPVDLSGVFRPVEDYSTATSTLAAQDRCVCSEATPDTSGAPAPSMVAESGSDAVQVLFAMGMIPYRV
jgi:hypothetical protein